MMRWIHARPGQRPSRGEWAGRRSTSPGYQFLHLNRFVLKGFVVFARACEQERIGLPGNALLDRRNDIRAADPVRFSKIGLRPLRWMVRMRVVETYNIEPALAPLALNADQFLWRDAVTVVGRVGAHVSGTHSFFHFIHSFMGAAQQHTTTLVRIGLFPMSPQRVVDGFAELKHCRALPPRIVRSNTYLPNPAESSQSRLRALRQPLLRPLGATRQQPQPPKRQPANLRSAPDAYLYDTRFRSQSPDHGRRAMGRKFWAQWLSPCVSNLRGH